jgi:S-adenosylmethionine synthetase
VFYFAEKGLLSMLEKVNKYHPDKVADRIAGAIVDYAYTLDDKPKIAVEVLVGHDRATVIAETSVELKYGVVSGIITRISGVSAADINFIQVTQDSHLSENQSNCVRCGDNGVFAARWNSDYEEATELAKRLGEQFPFDGKYLFDFSGGQATICQSNECRRQIETSSILQGFKTLTINPLGDWTGGINTDTGCTNRKLGSDQPYCNPNGLHGKDFSKADVSVSVYINCLSRKMGEKFVKAYCSIGDESVVVEIEDYDTQTVPFSKIVEFAREYITHLGGFEKFAEYGLIGVTQ